MQKLRGTIFLRAYITMMMLVAKCLADYMPSQPNLYSHDQSQVHEPQVTTKTSLLFAAVLHRLTLFVVLVS